MPQFRRLTRSWHSRPFRHFATGPGAECILARCGGLLCLLPENVTHHNASHASVRLAHCCDPTHPDSIHWANAVAKDTRTAASRTTFKNGLQPAAPLLDDLTHCKNNSPSNTEGSGSTERTASDNVSQSKRGHFSVTQNLQRLVSACSKSLPGCRQLSQLNECFFGRRLNSSFCSVRRHLVADCAFKCDQSKLASTDGTHSPLPIAANRSCNFRQHLTIPWRFDLRAFEATPRRVSTLSLGQDGHHAPC